MSASTEQETMTSEWERRRVGGGKCARERESKKCIACIPAGSLGTNGNRF